MSATVLQYTLSLSSRYVHAVFVLYPQAVPKLWNDTIETHRREVRDAVLHTTAQLVSDRGLRAVTMSAIAEQVGIGRATLYKYFSDVEGILLAWHERQIAHHLDELAEVRERAGPPGEQLENLLDAYAAIVHGSQGHLDAEVSAFLHRDEQVGRARQQLHALIEDTLAEAARAGHVRDDISPAELVSYCVHALAAASALPSRAAVRRLVEVTVDGLQPRAG